MLRWSEYFFLAVGFLCLGWVGFHMAESYVYQSYESYQLQESLKGRGSSFTGYIGSFFKHETDTAGTARPDIEVRARQEQRQETPAEYIDPGLIGRVEIPRLEISAVVREGVDSKTLSRAVGHVPTTALPGNPGNVAIAGHRDTYFRNVRNIRKGDHIRMTTQKGTFEYAVDSLKIVEPTDVKVLDPTADPAITLVTCYPFNYIGAAPKRFIVRARQILTEARGVAPAAGS
jgi:sortase A